MHNHYIYCSLSIPKALCVGCVISWTIVWLTPDSVTELLENNIHLSYGIKLITNIVFSYYIGIISSPLICKILHYVLATRKWFTKYWNVCRCMTFDCHSYNFIPSLSEYLIHSYIRKQKILKYLVLGVVIAKTHNTHTHT